MTRTGHGPVARIAEHAAGNPNYLTVDLPFGWELKRHGSWLDDTNTVLSDETHPLHQALVCWKIQRSVRMRIPAAGIERYRQSFVPRAVDLYNDLYRRGRPLEIESL